eukprot:TRINITY_DN12623_c0_g1_i1.p1 TRINITY_DN12623_c0_g1~~TRINITY_DN12623_c0_g1_i1.p1  ORF type:complete len:348 (+),score=53.71 TRINITY_DN12623_c0_g1_i1:272-1315(+)
MESPKQVATDNESSSLSFLQGPQSFPKRRLSLFDISISTFNTILGAHPTTNEAKQLIKASYLILLDKEPKSWEQLQEESTLAARFYSKALELSKRIETAGFDKSKFERAEKILSSLKSSSLTGEIDRLYRFLISALTHLRKPEHESKASLNMLKLKISTEGKKNDEDSVYLIRSSNILVIKAKHFGSTSQRNSGEWKEIFIAQEHLHTGTNHDSNMNLEGSEFLDHDLKDSGSGTNRDLGLPATLYQASPTRVIKDPFHATASPQTVRVELTQTGDMNSDSSSILSRSGENPMKKFLSRRGKTTTWQRLRNCTRGKQSIETSQLSLCAHSLRKSRRSDSSHSNHNIK